MYHPKFTISNQVDEFISIQRAKSTGNLPICFLCIGILSVPVVDLVECLENKPPPGMSACQRGHDSEMLLLPILSN